MPDDGSAILVSWGLLTAQDRKVQTFTAWVIRSNDQQDVSIAQQLVGREFVTGEDGQNLGKLLGAEDSVLR